MFFFFIILASQETNKQTAICIRVWMSEGVCVLFFFVFFFLLNTL